MTQEASGERGSASPERLVAGLVRLLDVRPAGENLFQGARLPRGKGRVFGGQVIGQALMAATKTVDPERPAHSLHGYFMRPGSEDFPIDYRVEADFDGSSFSNRRVVALQNGEPILNLIASFQRPEPGMHHQFPMPDVPPPEGLPTQAEYARANPDGVPPFAFELLVRPSPFELRAVDAPPFFPRESRAPLTHTWFRTVAPVHGDAAIHRAIVAMATDFALLPTSLVPHGIHWRNRRLQTASIDHAVWLHEEVRADEWHLYATDSPWSGHARGFNRGSIFTRDGRLVASVAQEGLIRERH